MAGGDGRGVAGVRQARDGVFSTATTVPRWVRVNGLRATAAALDAEAGSDQDHQLHLLLFDEDAYEELDGPVALEALDEWRYDNDWGSAGGVRLDVVAPGLVVERGWGDSAEHGALRPWPVSHQGRQTLVERWRDDHVPDGADDLAPEDLVEEPDPVLNGATAVVVRRRLGEATTFRTIHPEEARSRKALAALVSADPELHEVRRGELLEIAVDTRVMEPVDLLALLRPVGDVSDEDADAWPDAVVEAYGDVEASIEDCVGGARPVRRWVTVNGVRATGVLHPDDDQRLHLVLVDEYGEGLAAGAPLAGSHWYSDGLGAPTSGGGTYALEVAAPGLVVDRRVDDDDPCQRVVAWPESVEQRAEIVVGWVCSTEQEVAAALGLEPLDPSGVLDEHEGEVWRERVDEVELSFTLDAPAALVRAVRAGLDQPGSPYALTREALAEPTGERGAALGAVVDAWLAGEVTTGAVRNWTWGPGATL